MRSGHNFLSGLVFNELFYQGLLEKYDQEIFILNKDENIKLLLSNKIITVRNVKPSPNSKNQNVLKQQVILNNECYEINNDVITEITTEIGSYVKGNNQEVFNDKEKLDKELFKLNNIDDKLKKLNEIKANNIELIENFYDYIEYDENEESHLLNYYICLLFAKYPEYLSSYLLYPLSEKNLIVWYCNCRTYNYPAYDFKTNTEAIENIYNIWHNWHTKGSIIKYCNKEIEKLKTPKKTEIENTLYNLENIKSNYNRDKKVFKSPYGCEFYIYLMIEVKYYEKQIVFSYFFEIFKENKLLNNNIKTKDYLSFINNQFDLTETRLRKKLSNKIYNEYISFYLKCEKEFKNKANENQ